jgi:hypothetical protein
MVLKREGNRHRNTRLPWGRDYRWLGSFHEKGETIVAVIGRNWWEKKVTWHKFTSTVVEFTRILPFSEPSFHAHLWHHVIPWHIGSFIHSEISMSLVSQELSYLWSVIWISQVEIIPTFQTRKLKHVVIWLQVVDPIIWIFCYFFSFFLSFLFFFFLDSLPM